MDLGRSSLCGVTIWVRGAFRRVGLNPMVMLCVCGDVFSIAIDAGGNTGVRSSVRSAAYGCFPTPLGTEALYTRILICLMDRFKACVSNAFGEIF
jgi:hypothetical protein